MTWVAVAVVTALLVGFALYFFVFRWRGMARHGRLEVPCDEVIELPAGEHVIYYEDAKRWRYSEAPEIADGFSVLVSDPEGGRIHLEGAPAVTPVKISGRNRIPYARLRLPSAGPYRISATVSGEAARPHLTLG